MKKIKQEWSRAFIVRPRDHIQSHVFIKKKPFIPSYEYDPCPVPMSFLLGWEYARIWEKERDQFVAVRKKKARPKRIKNDFTSWLEKRKTKPTKMP